MGRTKSGYILGLAAVLTGMMTGSVMAEETSGTKLLSAQEALERMESDNPVVIVDVRTAQEYEEGHIENAILIPNEEIGEEKPELLPVEDAEILVYCRSGNRSAQAAQKLAELGYTNVSDFGGIMDWTYGTVEGAWEEKEGTYGSFRSVDLDGNVVDESIYSDYQLTMINVWGTFCGPCLNEMPELGELSAEYADKGVQILGLVLDAKNSQGVIVQSQVELARSLAEQTGAVYTHILPTEDLGAAGVDTIFSIPTTIFVDSEGNQAGEEYVGARSKDAWAEIIESLL